MDKFHHCFCRVDIHVHQMERQINMEHAAGIFPFHLPVGVGFLHCGGQ